MAAFEAAIRQNYPIELDVQLSVDGHVVVFHDETLKRTTGARGKIANQDLSSLKKLRLYDTDQSIPLLTDVLDLVDGRVPLLIEIKNKSVVGLLEQRVWETITPYGGDYAVQSFNPFSLGWFRDHANHVMRGQLASDFRHENLPWHKQVLLRLITLNGISFPHFVAFDLRGLPHWATQISQHLGLPLLSWVVRSDADQHKALTHSDNFIFDDVRP